jgi:hypothetical protein
VPVTSMCAQLLRMDVASKSSLRERRAKAIVVEDSPHPVSTLVEQGPESQRTVVVQFPSGKRPAGGCLAVTGSRH